MCPIHKNWVLKQNKRVHDFITTSLSFTRLWIFVHGVFYRRYSFFVAYFPWKNIECLLISVPWAILGQNFGMAALCKLELPEDVDEWIWKAIKFLISFCLLPVLYRRWEIDPGQILLLYLTISPPKNATNWTQSLQVHAFQRLQSFQRCIVRKWTSQDDRRFRSSFTNPRLFEVRKPLIS